VSKNQADITIEVCNASKIYHTYSTPRHRLIEIVTGGRRRYSDEKRALDDVSFVLKKGERLGVIGANGSGKSTLLKLLAGVLTASSGSVRVNGRVSAMLELGAGFNPDLAGVDNITQYCLLHGMDSEQIQRAMPEIIKFSELGGAVFHPVKTYSSGMAVRLGFACAVYVKPDILIVDEALSVGDAYFQNKCLHKIQSMLDQGVTFLYVTHSPDAIRSLCDQALWLEHGKVRLAGTSNDVGAAYQSEVFSRMVRAGLESDPVPKEQVLTDVVESVRHNEIDRVKQQAFAKRVEPLRTGCGEILIDDISVIDSEGAATDAVAFDGSVKIRVFFHVKSPPPEGSVLSLSVTDTSGRQLLHFSSKVHSLYVSDVTPHTPHLMEFDFHNPLCPGEYSLEAGIGQLMENPHSRNHTLIETVIDYCAGGARFSVACPEHDLNKDLWGVVHLDYKASMYSLD
jgi:lipopolysaccharide transport system ATP-binding protein